MALFTPTVWWVLSSCPMPRKNEVMWTTEGCPLLRSFIEWQSSSQQRSYLKWVASLCKQVVLTGLWVWLSWGFYEFRMEEVHAGWSVSGHGQAWKKHHSIGQKASRKFWLQVTDSTKNWHPGPQTSGRPWLEGGFHQGPTVSHVGICLPLAVINMSSMASRLSVPRVNTRHMSSQYQPPCPPPVLVGTQSFSLRSSF